MREYGQHDMPLLLQLHLSLGCVSRTDQNFTYRRLPRRYTTNLESWMDHRRALSQR